VANEADDVLADALAGPLADNFLAPSPPHRQDAALKREYRLQDAAISDQFKEQCIRFGEWRQRVYEWSRDGSSVARTTVDNNVSNLLLFAGYATAHAELRYRVRPAATFEMSVFGSVERLQPLALGYVRWLTRARKVLYSTTLGYLNSLIVVANFYAATLEGAAEGAFQDARSGGGAAAVVAGLRRLRAHAHGQAKREKVQRPVHPHWVSWAACQRARRRANRAFWERWDGAEGRALNALYKSLQNARRRGGGGTKVLALQVARNALFQSLQQLVYLYLSTINPPVRVSITRSLQFATTFVKQRSDPARYVIDLKNNPHSEAARHKTCATYRRAIFPCAPLGA
jgi:hypothetical protein